MLQLVFAVALSAFPLTIYVPPIRSFSLFIGTIEHFLRQTIVHALSAYPRLRFVLSRIYNNFRHST